jgi:hypothetical protein
MDKQDCQGSSTTMTLFPPQKPPVRDQHISYTTIHAFLSSLAPREFYSYTSFLPIFEARDLDRRQEGLAPAARQESNAGLQCEESVVSHCAFLSHISHPRSIHPRIHPSNSNSNHSPTQLFFQAHLLSHVAFISFLHPYSSFDTARRLSHSSSGRVMLTAKKETATTTLLFSGLDSSLMALRT